MSLAQKARENVTAALRLLPSEAEGNGEAAHAGPSDDDLMLNASASRAYYAAYQATVHRALDRGKAFDSKDGDYFLHHELPTKAFQWRILNHQQRAHLEWLLSVRVKADYLDEHVDREEARIAAERARGFVASVLRDEPE